MSRVRTDRWSNGRIALVGDAATCVSLFGDGSSLAIAGAATLATELGRSDHRAAFDRYEAVHRTLVGPKQRNLAIAAGLLVPATRAGIVARDTAMRLMSVVGARRPRRPAAT